MVPTEEHIISLHDQFVRGKISEKDKEILFRYLHENEPLCSGSYDEDHISNFLMTSHPDYGKPDNKGAVEII